MYLLQLFSTEHTTDNLRSLFAQYAVIIIYNYHGGLFSRSMRSFNDVEEHLLFLFTKRTPQNIFISALDCRIMQLKTKRHSTDRTGHVRNRFEVKIRLRPGIILSPVLSNIVLEFQLTV